MMDNQEKEILKGFITNNGEFEFKGNKLHSCLRVALGQARAATTRDENGKSHKTEHSGSWPGAILYFTFLEIVGQNFIPIDEIDNFKKKHKEYDEVDSLTYAFEHFGRKDLSHEEKIALKCLRNSFVHNFKLIHKPRGKKGDSLRTHKFNVLAHDYDFLIQVPKKENRWDGNLEGKVYFGDTSTSVNLHQLGNRAEEIYSELCKLVSEEKIVLLGDTTFNELIYGFSFMVTPSTQIELHSKI